MNLFEFISFILIIIGLVIVIINNFISRKNKNYPIKRNDGHDFCILIPARYESLVIEDLLSSIKKQSYKINMKDVYVIVESKEDETVNICKKYNATVIIRKHLELKRKGYAIDEAVKDILASKKHYDAYFIFDADNILDKDFIKNMIPIYDKGYDLASGYRNCKNGNKSVVAASSALTFSVVNTLFNNMKNKKTRNITFSGTGFYVRGYLIEKWGGYPFHTLTEDYEISSYAVLNNLTTYYNIKSIFYDEQPVKYKDTINQRIRWIRGYFDVRKIYTKKILNSIGKDNVNNGSKIDETVGIIPYIIMIIGLVILLISNVFNIIFDLILNNGNLKFDLLKLLLFFCIVYFVLFILTFIVLLFERNKIDLNFKSKLKVLFYNPFFMFSYIPCAIKALTKKEVKWTKVEHGK